MDPEKALLLEGVNRIELDLAVGLLREEGIPCVIEGPDFDVAELGRAAHDMIRGQNLYVPSSALERAREILDQAWSDEADDRDYEPGAGRELRSEPAPADRKRVPFLTIFLAAAVLVLGYLWIDGRETVARAEQSDPLFELQYHDDHLSWTRRSTGRIAGRNFDEDRDGITERTLLYDLKGRLYYESIDHDQDGVPESMRRFDRDGRLCQVAEDLDQDERVDRHVEHRRSGVRIEWLDTDDDGAFERREIYGPAGQLVRTEEDRELEGWVEVPR